MTDAWSLCCLLHVRSLISTLVLRAARGGGVGCYDPLTMVGHGIIKRTGAQRGAIPITTCHVSGAHTEEKEDPVTLKDVPCLSCPSLSHL